ncbi:MAG: hypothetical protein MUO21_01060, partial [Nitrososphaeraceae archaeon]|nr:hypothetical protein [Nitrososphaeraceae archaeon]
YEYPYSKTVEQPLQIELSQIEPLQNTIHNAKSENILHNKDYQQSYLMVMFILLCVLLFTLVIIIVFKK